jgi:hypothetical protein
MAGTVDVVGVGGMVLALTVDEAPLVVLVVVVTTTVVEVLVVDDVELVVCVIVGCRCLSA